MSLAESGMNVAHAGMKTPLARALASCRNAFFAVAGFSGIINLLMLTGALYMLQVYDRVLSSRSVPTLVMLSVLVVGLYAFQGFLEFIRGRILARTGEVIAAETAPFVFRGVLARVTSGGRGTDLQEPMRDIETLRGFLSSPGPTAIADLPWLVIFLTVVWIIHPWLGMFTLCGMLALCALTVMAEARGRKPVEDATRRLAERNVVVDSSSRGAEAIAAMGMGADMERRFVAANDATLDEHRRAADLVGGLGSVAKVGRYILQSAMVGLAAFLAINDQITAGAIFASNILAARALAPVDAALAQWRGFMAARGSYRRLSRMLAGFTGEDKRITLPAPTQKLEVTAVTIAAPAQTAGAPPGTRRILVRDVNFALKAGEGLGIVGPSASGKSTLARTIVGVWKPVGGAVSLDGAPLDRWREEDLGRHIGYLPQDVQLFDGTVAQNISRFRENASDEDVIRAAQLAGLHQHIMKLPQGYATAIGSGGEALSGGLRQRIGLARALFGDPFLLVLDEPNAALDQEGEEALARAMAGVRKRGGIVIVVAHRQSALAAVDHVLLMRDGQVKMFGPKAEVMKVIAEQSRPGQPSAPGRPPMPGQPPAGGQPPFPRPPSLPAQPAVPGQAAAPAGPAAPGQAVALGAVAGAAISSSAPVRRPPPAAVNVQATQGAVAAFGGNVTPLHGAAPRVENQPKEAGDA
jgi:ATP-binding cassette subfamily C protein